MSIDRWKNTQNVVTGILFSLEKEEDSVKHYNMEGPLEHGAQGEKPDTQGHSV